jgi:hypothetical protein
MEFKTLQEAIGEWHLRTFDSVNINRRMALKLVEEAREFSDSSGMDKTEAADCLIILMAWAKRNDVDIIQAAADKFQIVIQRDQVARDKERGLFL